MISSKHIHRTFFFLLNLFYCFKKITFTLYHLFGVMHVSSKNVPLFSRKKSVPFACPFPLSCNMPDLGRLPNNVCVWCICIKWFAIREVCCEGVLHLDMCQFYLFIFLCFCTPIQDSFINNTSIQVKSLIWQLNLKIISLDLVWAKYHFSLLKTRNIYNVNLSIIIF